MRCDPIVDAVLLCIVGIYVILSILLTHLTIPPFPVTVNYFLVRYRGIDWCTVSLRCRFSVGPVSHIHATHFILIDLPFARRQQIVVVWLQTQDYEP